MGASTDLVSEGVRRMIVNACYWAVGLEDKISEDIDVKEDHRGIVLTLTSWVLFDTGKYELKPISYRVLNQVGKVDGGMVSQNHGPH